MGGGPWRACLHRRIRNGRRRHDRLRRLVRIRAARRRNAEGDRRHHARRILLRRDRVGPREGLPGAQRQARPREKRYRDHCAVQRHRRGVRPRSGRVVLAVVQAVKATKDREKRLQRPGAAGSDMQWSPRFAGPKIHPVKKIFIIACLALAAADAGAQVKIGVIVSATGPAASLGIPEKNTIAMCPKTIGGTSVEYIVQDDATDTTNAVQVAKKLTTENNVDAIIGTSTTPAALAMLDVIADNETPTISLASSIRIIDPVDAKRTWMFKTPQTDMMMAGAILEHMAKNGVKSIGYIGFNDALGEAFFAEVDKAAKARGVPLVANERFAPKDTSVVGQSLKLMAAKPDAVIIGASGTPAALPARTLVEHGYKGKLYFNHGVAN